MSKEKELKRLHDIVFDGAPDWVTHAYRNWEGYWYWFGHVLPVPKIDDGVWKTSNCGRVMKYMDVPETTLHWTETLIVRKD